MEKLLVAVIGSILILSSPVFVFSASENMQCKEGLVLIFKINGNEACVKPTSVEKLLQRGWASYELTAAAKISIDDDLPDTEKISSDVIKALEREKQAIIENTNPIPGTSEGETEDVELTEDAGTKDAGTTEDTGKISIDDDVTLPPTPTGEFLRADKPDDFTDFDTTGLLAYYNFEEASGNLINVSPSADSLGSAADMTNTGVLYEQDCIMSKCYHYDDKSGKSQVVDIDLSTLNFPLSFNGWVKKNSNDGGVHIFMIADINTPEIFIGIEENPGVLLRVIFKNEGRWQSTTLDREKFYPDDGWVMVTGVVRDADKANVLEVYVNGVSREHEIWQSGVDKSLRKYLSKEGAERFKFPANLNTMAINLVPDASPRRGADAFYDEISFWDRELSPSEIRKLYNGGAGLSLLPS